jgi:hypothetical protein
MGIARRHTQPHDWTLFAAIDFGIYSLANFSSKVLTFLETSWRLGRVCLIDYHSGLLLILQSPSELQA